MNERDWHVAAKLIVARARVTLDEEAFDTERQRLCLLVAAHDGDDARFWQIIEKQKLDLQSKFRRISEMRLFLAVE